MTQKIADAIQVGEAKATAVANRARAHLAGAKKAMLIEITNSVEGMADAAFKTIQGNHQKLADNYLSLKAYAVTADAEIKKYVAAGKGRNPSSLGDLLQSIASLRRGGSEGGGSFPIRFHPCYLQHREDQGGQQHLQDPRSCQ